MAGKQRVFGAAFKAKVALAAAKGDRTTAELASQFGIPTGLGAEKNHGVQPFAIGRHRTGS